jgi:hypothetical protein
MPGACGFRLVARRRVADYPPALQFSSRAVAGST